MTKILIFDRVLIKRFLFSTLAWMPTRVYFHSNRSQEKVFVSGSFNIMISKIGYHLAQFAPLATMGGRNDPLFRDDRTATAHVRKLHHPIPFAVFRCLAANDAGNAVDRFLTLDISWHEGATWNQSLILRFLTKISKSTIKR